MQAPGITFPVDIPLPRDNVDSERRLSLSLSDDSSKLDEHAETSGREGVLSHALQFVAYALHVAAAASKSIQRLLVPSDNSTRAFQTWCVPFLSRQLIAEIHRVRQVEASVLADLSCRLIPPAVSDSTSLPQEKEDPLSAF